MMVWPDARESDIFVAKVGLDHMLPVAVVAVKEGFGFQLKISESKPALFSRAAIAVVNAEKTGLRCNLKATQAQGAVKCLLHFYARGPVVVHILKAVAINKVEVGSGNVHWSR